MPKNPTLCPVCGRINQPVGRWVPEACRTWMAPDPDCYAIGHARAVALLNEIRCLARVDTFDGAQIAVKIDRFFNRGPYATQP